MCFCLFSEQLCVRLLPIYLPIPFGSDRAAIEIAKRDAVGPASCRTGNHLFRFCDNRHHHRNGIGGHLLMLSLVYKANGEEDLGWGIKFDMYSHSK